MSVDELSRELERLRADVQALEDARAQAPAPTQPGSSVSQSVSPAAAGAPPDTRAAAGPTGCAAMGGDAPGSADESPGVSPRRNPDSESTHAGAVPAPDAADQHFKSQLEELGDLLHDELKSMPAVTSLTVFTLGILLGRFLR